jgi:hypothetical protein
VRRFVAAVLLGSAGVTMGLAPAHAAGSSVSTGKTDWNQRDTATYVVSTLNLLRTRTGKAVPSILAKRLHVARYDVFQDAADSGLFFIELKQTTGRLVATFVYHMGWVKPQFISDSGSRSSFLASSRYRTPRASEQMAQAYHTDPKILIGTFTSTLPS